jgi:hypothetical protein
VAPEPIDKPSRFEDHMVTLTYTSSAREAKQLAARLREQGIVALANAEPSRARRDRYGRLHETVYHPLVAVVSPDLERARAILAAEHPPEGEATLEEIEADLLRPDEDDFADAPEAEGPSLVKAIRRTGRRLLVLFVALVVASIGAGVLHSLLN